jgi:hypothetical protein
VIHCPRCGYRQYCGCKAYIKRIPDGYKPMVTRQVETPHGTACLEACAQCGFEMPCEWWEDLDYDIWLRYRGGKDELINNDATWREYQEKLVRRSLA